MQQRDRLSRPLESCQTYTSLTKGIEYHSPDPALFLMISGSGKITWLVSSVMIMFSG